MACDYSTGDGRSFAWVDHDDYSFRVVSPDGVESLCMILRSPEQTVGACDDGTESDLSRGTGDDGADLVYFDNVVWFRYCASDGYTIDGELGAEY